MNAPQVDSLEIVEAVMAIEEALEVELTDSEIEELNTKLRILLKRDPDALDDDDLLPSLVRNLRPGGPRENPAAPRPVRRATNLTPRPSWYNQCR